MSKKNMVFLDNEGKTLSINYKERFIKVNIIYRKRKSISIKITPKDKIDIISPKSVSIFYIKDLLINKIDWIYKTLDKFEILDESFDNRNYTDGEEFYYLGEIYKLKIIIDKNSNNKKYCFINIIDSNLVITTNYYDKEYIKNQLKAWYKLQSETIVLNEIEKLKKNNIIMR